MAFSLPNIVIKPDLSTLFHGDCPSVLPCPKTQEHQSTCVDSWVHRVPENGHQPLGRGNSLWHSACPILWTNPIFQRYLTEIVPSVLPCPKTQEHQSTCVDSWVPRVPENGHQPLGRGNSLWHSACPILWSNPIFQRYFTEIVPSVLPCPKTQEHQSTCVDSWVHRVPENRHQPLGRGNSLWRAACPILWSNPIVLCYFTKIAPSVLPNPKTQEHQSTCVDSWVHRVTENGHQPLGRGNSLWRSACPILWSNPLLLRYFTEIVPSVLPCPKTQKHQSTCVDSWVHRVPENGHQPLGRGNSLWHSACPIMWSNPILLTLFHGDRPLFITCPKTQEHQSTCVDSWVHRVPENGHQPLGRGNSLWHSACPILWSNPIFQRYFTEIVPSVLPCPKTQEHQSTCVDSWVHRVPENGHQPLGPGNSLWHSACPILWSNPIFQRYFTEIVPSVLPCPKTQGHQSTCVDSCVHRVPENGHQPLGRGNSLWRAACPILWSNPIVLCYFTKIAPSVLPCPKTQEHQSPCVDSWVHRVTENGHQPLGRGNSLWRSACPILWSNPLLLRYFTEIVPSVLPCPKTQEHKSTCVDSWVHRVPENGHQPLGRGNSLWHSACPILWSNPIL